MIIVCPSCDTSYRVPGQAAGRAGRKVKCAKCSHMWSVAPAQAEPRPGEAGDLSSEFGDHAFEQAQSQFFADPGDDSDPFAMQIATSGDEDALFAAVEGALIEDVDAGIDAQRDEKGNPRPEADRAPKKWVGDIESLAAAGGAGEDDAEPLPVTPPLAGRRRSRVALAGGLIALLLLGLAGAVSARHAVVRALPATAPLYAAVGLGVNLRGLEFRNVTFERSFENGLPVLAIHGEVVNITRRNIAVPQIRYGLKDAMKNEIYTWTGRVQAKVLEPDMAAPFVTRLQSPPGDAINALIRFTDAERRGGA